MGKKTALSYLLFLGQLMNAARIKQDRSILLHIQDKVCVAMGVRYHASPVTDSTPGS